MIDRRNNLALVWFGLVCVACLPFRILDVGRGAVMDAWKENFLLRYSFTKLTPVLYNKQIDANVASIFQLVIWFSLVPEWS